MGRDMGGFAEALGAGIVLPACTVAGFLVGRFAGRLLGWGEATAYAGAAVGVAAGFWNLFAIARRADRQNSGK